ncbi:CopD family protein [Rheinheimera pacifica]|uniref:CopD family protein n=1 Tax=Rheinheimera pacifica TaxID=173990 RepID=UPI002EDAD8EA
MVWLLFMHICALVIWAAALLILPLLIHHSKTQLVEAAGKGDAVDRLWFTRLASPVALLAIVSGTAIFAVSRNFDSWLLVKLTLVTALVVCHVLAGLLILYRKREHATAVGAKCSTLFAAILLLLLGIIVLVLVKPSQDSLLWFL